MNFSYHWLDDKGEVVVHDGIRTSLGQPLLPGDEVTLTARICSPEQTGKFTLRLTLVQERIAWFEQCRAKTLDFPILVGSIDAEYRPPK